MSAHVLIMAGGTGGHVYPALAVAEVLRRRGARVSWLGTRAGLEARVVAAAGIPIHFMRVSGLRGRGLLRKLAAPFMLLMAMFDALTVIVRLRPAVVLGMGGFAAGPGGVVAWLLRRPLVVHEQNAIPGLTNRLLARLAVRVLEAFPDSFAAAVGAQAVGNPVRADIAALASPQTRFADRHGAIRLLVLGGSQGAAALNRGVPAALARLDDASRPEVLHQCGRRHERETRSAYTGQGVAARVEPFLDDMAASYAWADLVVCRAGAMTVAELAAAGVGAVLVPFPYAVDDHQTRNAAFLCERGAACLLPEEQMSPERLAALLAELCDSRERLLEMACRARSAALPDAADVVATHCLEVAHD